MLPGDQHKKNENARVVAQWASLFRTYREIKSINAITPCLFVIPDNLKFKGLEWESELSNNRSLLELSHRLGGIFVLGREGSIPGCAPHGGRIWPMEETNLPL